MWYERLSKLWLIVGISSLLLATFFIIPTITSLYYYAWSEHLSWSYFDGPPMIAYFFYLSHAIFGHSFFTINFVGFCCFTIGSYYIYKLGYLLENRNVGLLSILIWAVLPLTTENVFIRAVYDAPLNLFTVMTFYYFARYVKQKETADIFRTTLCICGMILSKFTAAVSLLGILFYIIFSSSRTLLANKYFYIANLLMIVLLSPLFYWNVQHHWVTVYYLLNFHSLSENDISSLKSFFELTGELLSNFSIFIIISILGWIKYRKIRETQSINLVLDFLYITLFVSIAFWYLVIVFGGAPRAVYLTPLGINIAVTAAYTINNFAYHKLFNWVYPFFALIAIIVVIANSYPVGNYLRKGVTYNLVQNVLKKEDILNHHQPIVADSYTTAAILSYFMPNRPIYTLPCGEGNQYSLWSKSFVKAVNEKHINKIIYIDFENTIQCAEQYFKNCQLKGSFNYSKELPIVHKTTKPAHFNISFCEYPSP